MPVWRVVSPNLCRNQASEREFALEADGSVSEASWLLLTISRPLRWLPVIGPVRWPLGGPRSIAHTRDSDSAESKAGMHNSRDPPDAASATDSQSRSRRTRDDAVRN